MAKINTRRQVLTQAAEDGDSVAAAALHDLVQEEGETPSPCQPLKVGDWVYLYSATHAFVGQLAGIDHEEYVFKPPVTWVFETGELTAFVEQGVADYCEVYPAEVRARRGGTVFVARYPLGRHPKQKPR